MEKMNPKNCNFHKVRVRILGRDIVWMFKIDLNQQFLRCEVDISPIEACQLRISQLSWNHF
jgi:hypothetical protein